MTSPRKTPLALITVGPLIFGAPLGEEVATGQVKPEHFEKMREALASQREALASPHKRREIQQQRDSGTEVIAVQADGASTELPDSTCILEASTNVAVPIAAVRQPALTGGSCELGREVY